MVRHQPALGAASISDDTLVESYGKVFIISGELDIRPWTKFLERNI
jgi:hypothetical protein